MICLNALDRKQDLVCATKMCRMEKNDISKAWNKTMIYFKNESQNEFILWQHTSGHNQSQQLKFKRHADIHTGKVLCIQSRVTHVLQLIFWVVHLDE